MTLLELYNKLGERLEVDPKCGSLKAVSKQYGRDRYGDDITDDKYSEIEMVRVETVSYESSNYSFTHPVTDEVLVID